MTSRRRFLAFLAALPALFSARALAQTPTVRDIRHSLTAERFRLVFEFDSELQQYSGRSITGPERLIIDVPGGQIGRGVETHITNAVVRNLRFGYQNDKRLRFVLDLDGAYPHTIRRWATRQGGGTLLVVDLDLTARGQPTAKPQPQPTQTQSRRRSKRMVVVIDPGHGGKDPGAVGRRKTLEKDVALAISWQLFKLLKSHPHIVPYLTRGDDRYLRLRTRTRIARTKNPGLFVSVHADAARRRSARGASVYMLSTRGASSESAKWLADRENAADLIGGVELAEDLPPDAQAALLDMSQRATFDYSLSAGEYMIAALSRNSKMHSMQVERAGFAVLKSPDIPSLLVETGFISNSKEEMLLRSSRYQNQIAKAMYKGIVDYHKSNPKYS